MPAQETHRRVFAVARWRRAPTLALLSSLIAGACGSDGEGDGVGDVDYLAPLGSLSDLRSRLERVWCDNIAPCCVQFGIDYFREGCVELVRGYVDGSGTFVGHVFDPEVARQCVERSVEIARSCPASFEQIDELEKVCARVMGRLALGERCAFQHNCAPSPLGEVRCLTRGCTVMIDVPLGGACGELPDFRSGQCDEENGEFCSTAQRCEAGASSGERCLEGHCAPGLFCNADVCAPQVSPGGICVTAYVAECAGEDVRCENAVCTVQPANLCGVRECGDDEFCDSSDDTCKPRLADGEPCATGVCKLRSRCLCPSVRQCSTSAQRCFPGNLPTFCWGTP